MTWWGSHNWVNILILDRISHKIEQASWVLCIQGGTDMLYMSLVTFFQFPFVSAQSSSIFHLSIVTWPFPSWYEADSWIPLLAKEISLWAWLGKVIFHTQVCIFLFSYRLHLLYKIVNNHGYVGKHFKGLKRGRERLLVGNTLGTIILCSYGAGIPNRPWPHREWFRSYLPQP